MGFTKFDKKIRDEYEKCFDLWYIKMPKVVAYIWAVLCALGGIITAIACEEGIYLLISLGAVLAPLVYWCSKIHFSYRVTTLYYLKSIDSKLNGGASSNSATPSDNIDYDELPKI